MIAAIATISNAIVAHNQGLEIIRSMEKPNARESAIQAGIVRVNSAGWLINMLARKMDSAMEEALSTFDVSMDQFKVIMTLMENEGVTQAEIGKRIELPSYAVTRLLDTMAKIGLLERHPDKQSRRSFNIRLTPKGKTLGPKLFKTVIAVNQEVLLPLSEEEKQQLTTILQKLAPDWSSEE